MKIERNPSTDADVQRLLSIFPDLLPDGQRITHEQLEAVLSLSRLSSRYRTVVRRWRRITLSERRVFLDGRIGDGSGFVTLTPDQMVRYANREVRSAGRKMKKAIAIASAPNDEELSADVLKYRQLLAAATLRIAKEHRAALQDVGRALRPMKQLPRAVGE
jgi:hypothetical protein